MLKSAPDRTGNVAVATGETSEEGRVVHLKGYGMIKIFKTVSKNGDVEVWATNDLNMTALKALSLKEKAWGIEMYHRGLEAIMWDRALSKPNTADLKSSIYS